MAQVPVTKARPEDRERLADAFADAFAEDPIFLWLMAGKPRTDRRLQRFFRVLVRDELRHPDHEVYLTEEATGGAIWKGIDQWKTTFSTIVRQLPGLTLAFGVTNTRPWAILGAMEKVHPREPHYYLETLGTRRSAQGKGIGSAVMEGMLERCDREGVPAYLESSNPRNIPFYGRHGFVVRDPVPLPAGAPVLTPMWREPRSP